VRIRFRVYGLGQMGKWMLKPSLPLKLYRAQDWKYIERFWIQISCFFNPIWWIMWIRNNLNGMEFHENSWNLTMNQGSSQNIIYNYMSSMNCNLFKFLFFCMECQFFWTRTFDSFFLFSFVIGLHSYNSSLFSNVIVSNWNVWKAIQSYEL